MRAWQLKQAGWNHRRIALALGVGEATVSRWIGRAHHGRLVSGLNGRSVNPR
jgi:hypothetical protein